MRICWAKSPAVARRSLSLSCGGQPVGSAKFQGHRNCYEGHRNCPEVAQLLYWRGLPGDFRSIRSPGLCASCLGLLRAAHRQLRPFFRRESHQICTAVPRRPGGKVRQIGWVPQQAQSKVTRIGLIVRESNGGAALWPVARRFPSHSELSSRTPLFRARPKAKSPELCAAVQFTRATRSPDLYALPLQGCGRSFDWPWLSTHG